jgi:hypothetical protein
MWYLLCVTGLRMIRRVLRYLATFGGAGLLAVASVVVSPLVWPPDPDASLVLRNGQFVGEVVGYVWGADPDTATIQVSSSLVGFHTVPVAVSSTTRITEGQKEGAFGDLDVHRRVRVVYEFREHLRVATSIELLRAGEPATTLSAAASAAGQPPAAGYWVEVGTFTDAESAGVLVTRLLEHNLNVSLESVSARAGQPRVLRVQVGPFPDEAAAAAAQQNLRAIGYEARAIAR